VDNAWTIGGLWFSVVIVHTVSSIGARWPIVWTMWTMIYFYIEKSNKYIVLMAYMVILLEQASD
jgi:hypothetical protein